MRRRLTVVVATGDERVAHCDIVCAHQVDLVLPGAVPRFPVAADPTEFDIAGFLRVVAVDHRHVAHQHILAVMDEHHAGEV